MVRVTKRDLARHLRRQEVIARLDAEGMKPRPSLLESVSFNSLFPPSIRSSIKSAAASEAICVELDKALQTYQAEARRDKDALIRFCNSARQQIDSHKAAADLKIESRHALLGRYVEAALLGKRRAGRPSTDTEGLFLHVWHVLNLELQSQGKPLLIGKVPRKEIAERCAREGLGAFSPDQVGKALAPSKRSIPCPYYAEKNTEN